MLGNGEILAPIRGIEEGKNVFQMSGFEFVNMIEYGLKDKRYTTNLLPYCSCEVITMMKKMGYMPSMVLERKEEGWLNSPTSRPN